MAWVNGQLCVDSENCFLLSTLSLHRRSGEQASFKDKLLLQSLRYTKDILATARCDKIEAAVVAGSD
jgi:hypothetical protein